VNRMLVTRHDCIDGRIFPGSHTLEAEFVFVVGQRAGDVGGEEYGRDATDHGLSVRQPMKFTRGPICDDRTGRFGE
jgi:hypothetical protein